LSFRLSSFFFSSLFSFLWVSLFSDEFGGSNLSTYPLIPGGPTTYRLSHITEPSLHGTLKIDYQVYHSKQERKKRKSKFFIATILSFTERLVLVFFGTKWIFNPRTFQHFSLSNLVINPWHTRQPQGFYQPGERKSSKESVSQEQTPSCRTRVVRSNSKCFCRNTNTNPNKEVSSWVSISNMNTNPNSQGCDTVYVSVYLCRYVWRYCSTRTASLMVVQSM
jgi:hypothetical protein